APRSACPLAHDRSEARESSAGPRASPFALSFSVSRPRRPRAFRRGRIPAVVVHGDRRGIAVEIGRWVAHPLCRSGLPENSLGVGTAAALLAPSLASCGAYEERSMSVLLTWRLARRLLPQTVLCWCSVEIEARLPASARGT